MEEKKCLLCGNSMISHGIGHVCQACGYAHIPSPVGDSIEKAAKNKKIILIVLVILIVWVIPAILLNILQ